MTEEKKTDVDAATGKDGEVHDRTKWNPTPEQFAAYFSREVEMAREKVWNDSRRGQDTLHSSASIAQALLELEREGRIAPSLLKVKT